MLSLHCTAFGDMGRQPCAMDGSYYRQSRLTHPLQLVISEFDCGDDLPTALISAASDIVIIKNIRRPP
jgi:hypothetical protein